MKNSILVLASALLLTQAASAGQSVERKLFTLEKSLNSENILNIHTQTDENCKFVTKNNEYVDFYWLMDRKNLKQVHPKIRSTIHERVQFVGINARHDSFKVRLNDLSEIKHDLESNIIEVRAEIVNGACTVNSIIQLGASSKYKELNLKRTYCEVNTVMGIPNGCKFLELSGVEKSSAEVLKIRYKGK